ncbi:hypothetical protein MINS_05840 [Mycolicibacterium insubricum]|uniref:Protein kinase domain-containing protein n=1 Tax=Mycolicibacterium insubricum TaxID=444597 RepID=A0A1X0DH33_9MYCO|nr:serine/threonine-protein kinase [Mycolicibacterium insubricum]MCV7081863.1 serine/threonine protein kinase [Mycolicibacterium insubricum]ORA71617.1 hypothetical protein BST26_07495 [Mycolicibacterium insubricum]BBZ65155.1 hypothetical protein MINS_05840 [Mycolicibacterium insubricum]
MTWASTGDRIANRYDLKQFLGAGTYGEVWRAFDRNRGYEVALKLILNRDSGATWREATILTALRSEHIVEVHNADQAVDLPYLATDLAECSLDVRAQPWGVEPGLAVDWMRRALRGLDLCHKRGLLHRDVKPHNIFLARNGSAKLGDFGIAALMDGTGTADAHGDVRIKAPELHSGGRSSVQSDIYSAACTLYGLVAGRLPYEAGDSVDDILHGKYVPVRDRAPHVSQALAEKIRKGMALDPADRYLAAADFDNALAIDDRHRIFTPQAPHNDHLRCWHVTGRGSDLHVCITGQPRARRYSIETRFTKSGNRVRAHCMDTTESQLPGKLRAVFNTLARP